MPTTGQKLVQKLEELSHLQEQGIHDMVEVWRNKKLPLPTRRLRIQEIGRDTLANTDPLMAEIETLEKERKRK